MLHIIYMYILYLVLYIQKKNVCTRNHLTIFLMDEATTAIQLNISPKWHCSFNKYVEYILKKRRIYLHNSLVPDGRACVHADGRKRGGVWGGQGGMQPWVWSCKLSLANRPCAFYTHAILCLVCLGSGWAWVDWLAVGRATACHLQLMQRKGCIYYASKRLLELVLPLTVATGIILILSVLTAQQAFWSVLGPFVCIARALENPITHWPTNPYLFLPSPSLFLRRVRMRAGLGSGTGLPTQWVVQSSFYCIHNRHGHTYIIMKRKSSIHPFSFN